jgi:hypothetical protein
MKLDSSHPSELKQRALQVKKIIKEAEEISNMDPKAAFLKIAEKKRPSLLTKDRSKAANIGPGLFSGPEARL